MKLQEKAAPGLHDYIDKLIDELLTCKTIKSVLELGCGSGAFAIRLKSKGLNVECADIDKDAFELKDVLFYQLDFNEKFHQKIDKQYDLIISMEVIEHLYNPFLFLKNMANLLNENGIIIMTTPNVDNLPTRLRFLFTSQIRMFDEKGDPSHLTPIFYDIFVNRYLKDLKLSLCYYRSYPENSFVCSRSISKIILRLLCYIPFFKGNSRGDINIFLLEMDRHDS